MNLVRPIDTVLYCTECGKQLIPATKEGYDVNTGQILFLYSCPTDICEHTGVRHNMISRKWYQWGDDMCTKCKKIFVWGW